MTVMQGEWVTIIGSNGSGKSTLLKAMAGLLRQEIKGKIVRNKGELTEAPTPIVMQQPDAGIIGSTAWEDIVIMMERHGIEGELIQRKVEEALLAVGLKDKEKEPIDSLSGGQKQLVAIAGCLAIDAQMLLLDEVTAMLDPIMSLYVLEKVRELHQSGASIIWITQKLDELEQNDRVIVLDEGKIVYDGSAAKMFQRSTAGKSDSVCERYFLEAPYAVQVAWELEKEGIYLSPIPLKAEQLAEAVIRYGC